MTTYKQGWEAGAGGGNMVKNSRTGQQLDIYHPDYQDDVQAPPVGPLPPGQPGSVPLNQGPKNATQAVTQQANVGSQAIPGQPATVAGSFQQALVNKLNAQPVSAASPSVQPAIQANQLSERRGFDRNRALLAEQNAASGLSASGGNNAMVRGLAQDRAGREGTFAGNAVMDGNKLQSAEIMAALGLGGNLLNAIDQRELQRYGIDTDAALRREGLGATTSLGRDDIALRGELGRGNLNLGLLGLLQGGEQFGQSLGLQAGLGQASLNQQALLALLGGL